MSESRRLRNRPIEAALWALLLAAVAGPLSAQLQTGDLHGAVSAADGTHLPGVTIEVGGPGATHVGRTDGRGAFHFLALDPGVYRVVATLDGYAPVLRERVTIAVGRNTAIEMTMLPAVEEEITVTAESALLDERKVNAGTTITRTELEKVPSARDPWAVLQTVPGVLTSAVNVGGNKSGMQQSFTGSGSASWDNSYAVDGVVISDVGAGNSSPTYYDFEAFEEIEVSTGGSDVSNMGGGVTLNLVTRRGTNDWRASARDLVADQAWQSDLAPDPGQLGAGQEQLRQGDRIVRIEEYGVEGGGPLVRDRLWGWGFYGRNDIDRLTIDDVRDFTQLKNYGSKLNAQLSPVDSAVALFHYGNKVVDGRGAGPTRTEPATWNQDGPSSLYKLEDTHVFGSRLFLTGLVSYLDGGFSLTPKGGVDGLNPLLDESFVWRNNTVWWDIDRDQEQARLDGGYFLTAGSFDHEIRFGAGYRLAESVERTGVPGNAVRYDFYRTLYGEPYDVAEIYRNEVYAYATEFTNLFVQDTVRRGRLTANLGIRFDRQEGELDAASVPAVPGFETLPDGTPLLPAVAFDGRGQGFAWEDLAPRLGLTWALGPRHATLLRASYSRFTQPMDQWYQYLEWPIGPSYAGFYYEDADGDGRVTVDEIVGLEPGALYTNGYDPLARRGLADVDPGFRSPLGEELILSVEHSFLPELVVGLAATWRSKSCWDEYERLVEEDGGERPHQRGDYELQYVHTVRLPDGSASEIEVYGLRDGVRDTGRLFVATGDRETDYLGLDLTLHKRLSKNWMVRGHVSWSEWTWSTPQSEREDPNVRAGWSGWDDDGGPVYMYPMTAGWSYRLGGLVRIAPDRRWGFDVAGNLWGRQGYAVEYFTQERGVFETEPRLHLQANRPLDAQRLPDLHLMDLRIEKEIRLGDFEASVAVECFNVLNQSTVLQRNGRLGISTTDWVQEVVSPRVFRLSARLRFR